MSRSCCPKGITCGHVPLEPKAAWAVDFHDPKRDLIDGGHLIQPFMIEQASKLKVTNLQGALVHSPLVIVLECLMTSGDTYVGVTPLFFKRVKVIMTDLVLRGLVVDDEWWRPFGNLWGATLL
jgi:hypothetical protein